MPNQERATMQCQVCNVNRSLDLIETNTRVFTLRGVEVRVSVRYCRDKTSCKKMADRMTKDLANKWRDEEDAGL